MSTRHTTTGEGAGPVLRLPVSVIRPAPWDYKHHEEVRAQKLRANIERHARAHGTGQIETVLVRELGSGKYEVVNGKQRLKVLKGMGVKQVWAVNVGTITDEEAKRIDIELNETRFPRNEFAYARMVCDVVAKCGIGALDTLPVTEDEYQLARKTAATDFDARAVAIDKYNSTRSTQVKFSLTIPEQGARRIYDAIVAALDKAGVWHHTLGTKSNEIVEAE